MATAEPKPICLRIGQAVRERRLEIGLSLNKLAERIEMSKAALWEIEMGNNEPRAGTLLRLCNVLGLSADAILGVEPLTRKG